MMVFNSKEITTCFGQQRSSSGYYNFAQRVSYICLYCEVILRYHHRYALQSVYLVGCLMVNDWEDVNFWGGIWGGGGVWGPW